MKVTLNSLPAHVSTTDAGINRKLDTMPTERYFEHHEEVVELHGILTSTWYKVDPNSNITKYPTSYQETFLDLAKAIVAAGYHKAEPQD